MSDRPLMPWDDLVMALEAEYDQGHMAVRAIVESHMPAIERAFRDMALDAARATPVDGETLRGVAQRWHDAHRMGRLDGSTCACNRGDGSVCELAAALAADNPTRPDAGIDVERLARALHTAQPHFRRTDPKTGELTPYEDHREIHREHAEAILAALVPSEPS